MIDADPERLAGEHAVLNATIENLEQAIAHAQTATAHAQSEATRMKAILSDVEASRVYRIYAWLRRVFPEPGR